MTTRYADETGIIAVERIGGEGGWGYPSQGPSSACDGREDSASYWKVFGARRASPRCVVAKVLRRAWSKEFLQAGKRRLAGDTAREATSQEVKMLRAEARALKDALSLIHI